MPQTTVDVRSFKGLFRQRNSFTVPDGALEIATNINISKDDIITSRRGMYAYFTPSGGTLNRAFNYNENLVLVYGTKASYLTDGGSSPNETGTETALSGATVLVNAIVTSRGLQANSNLYFTTDNGPLKLPAYNGTLTASGAPQGLDLFVRFLNGTSATWLSDGNTVGYRILFGYVDANGNLILGAPSDIIQITNTKLLSKAYTSAAAGAPPWTITVTSTAHGLVTGQYLNFTNGGSSNANGVFKITVASVDTFTYSVTAGDPGAHNVDYAFAMPVRIESTIPTDVSTAQPWFYQIYRSSQVSTGSIFDDFQLVTQKVLSAAEISAGIFFFTDSIPEVLRGANLYTNENSGEGEAQANYRPPYCLDMTFYKGYALYANVITRQILYLNVIDSTVIAAADYVEIKVSATRRYVARTVIGNQTVRATCSSSGGLLVTITGHDFVNGDLVYASNQTAGSLADGYYYVVSIAANTLKLSLTPGGAAIAYNSETSVEIQGVTDGTNPIFFADTASNLPSVRLSNTARALVKAVNRDTSSVVYANYVSPLNGVPGQMQFQSKGFTTPISMRAVLAGAGTAFSPSLPAAFNAGTQVTSINSTLLNTLFSSKLNEPEAVPLVNFFHVGSASKKILCIVTLRDSVIILKEDGIFRLTGDTVSNFVITILDSTVHCLAANSVDVINNQVVFLSNQGVCLCTESSVQIISRPIEDDIQPILGQSGLAAQTCGQAYETERMYLLTTTDPNSTTATVTHAYNILTHAWTRWDELFAAAVIGPNDSLYTVSTGNVLKRERKKQTRIDFTGQNYAVTISTVASDGLSCTLTSANHAPAEGDIIVKSSVLTWVISSTLVSGTTYSVILSGNANLVAADNLFLYAQFTKTFKLSPFHGGLIGRLKFFSQMQVHLKDSNVSKAYISYANDTFAGSEVVTWTPVNSSGSGWGQLPWGFSPWGQQVGISITQGTLPAPIMRVYIPSFAARTSFIQPTLEMRNGADMLNIQGLSFTLRAYGERESR